MKKSIFSLAVLLFVLLGACVRPGGKEGADAGASPGRAPGSVIIAVASEPATFDLHYAASMVEGWIGNNIYDGLLFFDDEGNIEPLLAEDYDVSPDGLTYTFRLRKGVKFHNGEEFTARDVAFTIEYGRTAPNASLLCGMIRDAAVPDDYTIILTLKEPMASFLSEFAGNQFSIYNEKAVRAADVYGSFPVGTGAYRFTGRSAGTDLFFEAFPDYFRGEPAIKRLVFRVIPDDFTAAVALETGEIDLIMALSGPAAVSLRDKSGVVVSFDPSTRVNYSAMNTERPPFNDARLRRAVNYALDRETIRSVVYEGGGSIKDYLAFPWMAAFAEPETRYAYDPRKAAALALEAGVSPESPVEAVLIAAASSRQAAEIVRQNLAVLGLNITVEILEFNAWIARYYRGDYQIACGGHYMNIKDMNYLGLFYESANIDQGNSARYHNPAVDELFVEARRTREAEKRRVVYRQIADIVQDDAPYAVFANPPVVRAYRRDLRIARTYSHSIYVRDISWDTQNR
ncbi:MAG: ABC transporter substrate-binding protein [Spirochaetaceae bacterium]|nr:ABC transporter substrate-binding protein [Spirochaetaceae bacterium]